MIGGNETDLFFMGALINKSRSRSKEIAFFAGPVVIVTEKIALTSAHIVHLIEVRFPNHPTSLAYIILCFSYHRTAKAMSTLGQTASDWTIILLASTTRFVITPVMGTSSPSAT